MIYQLLLNLALVIQFTAWVLLKLSAITVARCEPDQMQSTTQLLIKSSLPNTLLYLFSDKISAYKLKFSNSPSFSSMSYHKSYLLFLSLF